MNTLSMTREEMDREIDLAVAGSFPASDPPPWTLGATPPAPPMPRSHSPAAIAPAAVDVVIAAGGTRQKIASLVGLIAMGALIPAGVFVVATPVLAAVWALRAASTWLAGGQ